MLNQFNRDFDIKPIPTSFPLLLLKHVKMFKM